jgi:hypothetical protein
LFVGTSRRNGDLLILCARYSILSYAVYGLIALVLTPDMLLWISSSHFGVGRIEGATY